MIDFNCPKCGTEISADDEKAGKRGRCPDCKESFVIPDAEPPRKKKPARDEDDDEAVAESPRKRKPSRDEDDDDRPTRRRDRDDEDEEDDADAEPTAFPITVTLAGIGWIVFGSLILIGLIFMLLGMFVFAGAQKNGAEAGGVIGGALCGGLIGGLFGAAFIFVGVQSVRGTANDTLGNGVGSIIFAFLDFGLAALNAAENPLQSGIYGLCGFGLLAAGILALIGRSQYKAWRKAERRRNDDRRRR
jgi:hypothetical protein